MSVDTTQFQGFSYIKDNGINKYLVEEYLLPGLAVQSRLGKGSRGIPLPTPFGKPQEFIKLEDAANLILSWLEDNNHLYAKDKGQLIKLMRKVSYEQFATIASEIYKDRIEDPNKLFTTARQQNLTLYREAQKKQLGATAAPKFDPGRAIDEYNALYAQLLRAANIGISPSLFQKILPTGVPVGNRDLSKQILVQVIVQNISELRSAAHAYAGDEPAATLAISHKLAQIISESYPEQSAYLNLLGDKETSRNLNRFTENIEKQLTHDGVRLAEVDDLKTRAIGATTDNVLTEYEIYQQIRSILPITREEDKKKFAKTLIQTINSNFSKRLTSQEIISLAATQLGIDSTQILSIQSEFDKSGLSFAIEYRQNELSLIVGSHQLTRAEYGLLRRGINPFKTEKSEVDLTIEKDQLLKEFQIDSGTKFASVEEAHQFEQKRDKPNTHWIRRFREHEDQVGAYSFLDSSEKNLVNRTRFGRWIENSRSRVYEIQSKFFDKWIEFDENLPWNKGIRAAYEWYDKLAENFTIKIGKTQIPLFRIVPWIYDRIDEWKKVTTASAIARTSAWKNPIGKFVHWNLQQYKLGDYTVNGAMFETFRSAWGSSTKWVLERSTALATKMGVGSAFKYASVSASRTATRLLLQIGGRALARFGEKAVGALVAAATGIGAVFSFALSALMVVDLIKLGWNFVKNFFTSADFRGAVTKVGVAVGAIVLAIPLAASTVLTAVSVLILSVLQPILLALSIIGIMILVNNHNLSDLMTTIRLDPGSALQQIAVNLLCDDDSTGVEVGTEIKSAGSSIASCANCLAKYLAECYGQSVTSSNIAQGLSCLAAKAISPESISIIERSASSFTYLQCVGFVQASIACAGGSLAGANACGYIGDVAPGWKFVRGTVGAQPGDPIVFNSSGTCNGGAPGHIGIMTSDAGALICLTDANQVCNGCVAQNNCLPKTNMAGFLKKL